MLKIESPNKSHSGVTAGVGFSNGIGYTENEDLKGWFEDKGYTVSKTKEKDADSQVKDLEDQVTKLAEENELLKAEKADLEARLEEYEDGEDDTETTNGGNDTGGNKGKGNRTVKVAK